MPSINFLPDEKDVSWLWENTTAASKMRNLVVDSAASALDLSKFNSTNLTYPNEYLCSMIQRLPQFRKSMINNTWREDWKKMDVCRYHEYANGINCQEKPSCLSAQRRVLNERHDEEGYELWCW